MYKLVKEHINNFTRGQDPKVAMSIGKKVLITNWLDEMGIENYVINDDLTIDVKGNVHLRNKELTHFPSFIKFGKVEGYFTCSLNELESLEGCPNYVSKWFDCSENQLESLDGCPSYVGNDFYCYNNKVKFTGNDVRKLCDVKIIYNI